MVAAMVVSPQPPAMSKYKLCPDSIIGHMREACPKWLKRRMALVPFWISVEAPEYAA